MNHAILPKLENAVYELRRALTEQQNEAANALDALNAGIYPSGIGRPVDLSAKAHLVQELAQLAIVAGIDSDDVQALCQGKTSGWDLIDKYGN